MNYGLLSVIVINTAKENEVLLHKNIKAEMNEILDSILALKAAAEDKNIIISEGDHSGQLTISTAEGGPALTIEDVVVAKGWRPKGVGRCLMSEISRWSSMRGVSRLQLLADKTNVKALGFYKNIGWRSTKLICLRNYNT